MPQEETLELRLFFAVIRRWAWLLAGCTVLALAVALALTYRLPPSYEATTTLLVAPADHAGASEYTTLMAGERLAVTYSQMLKGRSTLASTIARLGLDETPETLEKRVQTQTVADTQLVRVTVKDASPVRAALIANTIGEVFIDHTKALQESRYQGDLAGKAAKIEAQRKLIDETQAQIGAASAKKASDEAVLARVQGLLTDYRTSDRNLQGDYQSLQLLVAQAKDTVTIVEAPRAPATAATGASTAFATLLIDHGAASPDTDYTGILASERLAGTYAQMMTGRSVLEAAIARLGIEQSSDALAAMVSAEPIANTQLVRLQVTGADAEQSVALANAIAEAFVDQMAVLLQRPYAEHLAGLQTEIARLSALIDETEAQVQIRSAAYLQSESELALLEDTLAAHRSDYRVLQQDYEQVRLTASQTPGTVVITERANEPQQPVRSRWLYVMLAGVIAMLVALGIAFLIEYLNDSIRTPEDVSRALGLGTLGMIGQFEAGQEKPVLASRPHSVAAEAFRVLATNVRLTGTGSRVRTMVVTSPAPDDGKSAVAANLAIAMAGAGLRVVVVDADLRSPRQHVFFGVKREQGLTDSLWQGSTGCHLKPAGVEGVRILTSGKLPLDPVGLINSPRMKGLLEELAQEADLVIVDTPPVLAVADTTILAAGVDGVLLVVRAGHTGRQPARRALEALRQVNTPLLGVVLNGVPDQGGRYYRYYDASEEAADTGPGQGQLPRLLPWGFPDSQSRWSAAWFKGRLRLTRPRS